MVKRTEVVQTGQEQEVSLFGFSAARISKPGDICVMLAADHLPVPLQKHLDTLQKMLGGHPPDMVHVTLQRFEIPAPEVGKRLVDSLYANLDAARLVFGAESLTSQDWRVDARLRTGEPDPFKGPLPGLEPFSIRADGFMPLHSDFRNYPLLKWRVPASPELERAYLWVDQLGQRAGAKPMYSRRTASAMVTAMLDIVPEKIGSVVELAQVPIPQPLFTGSRLVTSRIVGPNQYEILGQSLL